jgi:hypothetical protein
MGRRKKRNPSEDRLAVSAAARGRGWGLGRRRLGEEARWRRRREDARWWRRGGDQGAGAREEIGGLTGSDSTLIVGETARLPARICCRRSRKLALCTARATAAISDRDPSPTRHLRFGKKYHTKKSISERRTKKHIGRRGGRRRRKGCGGFRDGDVRGGEGRGESELRCLVLELHDNFSRRRKEEDLDGVG